MIKKIQNGVLLALMLVAMVTSSVSAAPWWEELNIPVSTGNTNSSGSLNKSIRINSDNGNLQVAASANWIDVTTASGAKINTKDPKYKYVLDCSDIGTVASNRSGKVYTINGNVYCGWDWSSQGTLVGACGSGSAPEPSKDMPAVENFNIDNLELAEFIYNGTEQTVESFITPDEGMGELTISFNPVTFKNTGTYEVFVTTEEGENFAATEDAIKLADITIDPATINITWTAVNDAEYTYDGEDHAPAIASFTGVVSADEGNIDIDIKLTDETQVVTDAINSGSYTATAAITNNDDGNYVLDGLAETLNFVVNRKAITLDWGNTDFTYTGIAQVPAPTTEDLIESDAIETVVSVSVIGEHTNASAVAYTATAEIKNDNYILTGDKETENKGFFINPAEITLDWSSLVGLVYNGGIQNPAISVESGLVDGQDESILTLGWTADGEVVVKNAGNYNATAAITNPNYSLTNPTNAFSIAQYETTVVWGNLDLLWTGAAQKPTAKIVGLGDDGEIALEVSGEQTNINNAYEATATLPATEVAANYTLNSESAITEFAIYFNKREPIADDFLYANVYPAPKYSGNPQTAEASITFLNPNGDAIETELHVTYLNNADMSEVIVPINAGEYSVLVNPAESDFFLEPSAPILIGTFEIDPAEITIEWSSETEFTYNGKEQYPEYTVNGLKNGELEMVLNLSIEGATNASENYTASIEIDNPNYVLIGLTAQKDFVINPKSINLSYANELLYNGAEQTPEVTANGLAEGESQEVLGLTVTPTAKNASTIPYNATAAITNTNYTLATLADANVEFTITKAPAAVVWDNLTVDWTGLAQTPTAKIAGLGDDDDITLTVSGAPQTAAGEYPVTAELPESEVAANYTLTNDAETFKIERAAVGNSCDDIPVFNFSNGTSVNITSTAVYQYNGKLYARIGSGTIGWMQADRRPDYPGSQWWIETGTCEDTYAPSFTVSFNLDGGANGPANFDAVEDISIPAPETEPTKDGVSFSHWSFEQYGTAIEFPFTLTGNVTLWAVWTKANITAGNFTYTDAEVTYKGEAYDVASLITADEGISASLNIKYNELADAPRNAGIYTITVQPVESEAFAAADAPIEIGTFTITKAEQPVIWDNLDLPHTGAPQKPTAKIEGLGDDEDIELEVSGEQTEIGTEYPATAALPETDVAANYTLQEGTEQTTFVISVVKRVPTADDFEYAGETLTYTGTVKSASNITAAPNMSEDLGIVYLNGDMEVVEPINVGVYKVAVNPAANDYFLTLSTANLVIGELEITPATITLTWSEEPLIYNGTDQAPEITLIDGIVDGEDDDILNLEITGRAKEVNVDGYTANAEIDNNNYVLDEDTKSCNFVINPLELEIVWGDTEFDYTGAAQVPEADFAEGEEAKIIGTDVVNIIVEGEETNAGNYTATASFDNTNYVVKAPSTVDFSIAPISREVIWGNTTFEWTGIAQKPTATITNASEGGVINLVVSGAEIEPGTYTATAALPAELTGNYTITNEETEFTINEREVLGNTCEGIFDYGTNGSGISFPVAVNSLITRNGHIFKCKSAFWTWDNARIPPTTANDNSIWTYIGECENIYAPSFNVSFNLDGGIEGPAGFEAAEDARIPAPEITPTKEGYTFKHWSFEQNGQEISFPFTLTKDTTIWAVWLDNSVNLFNVSFELDGATEGPADFVEEEGANINTPKTPKKEGYTFLRWSFEQNGEEAIDFPFELTQNTTIWAVWREGIVQFNVSFNLHGGTGEYTDFAADEYTQISKPETNPAKEGFIFKHWSFSRNGDAIDFPFELRKDVTLWAVWNYGDRTGDGTSTSCDELPVINGNIAAGFTHSSAVADGTIFTNGGKIYRKNGTEWWISTGNTTLIGNCEPMYYADGRDFQYDDLVLVYNGTNQSALASITAAEGVGQPLNISYLNEDGDELSSDPKNVGTYIVRVQPEKGTKFLKPLKPVEIGTITITKAPLTVDFTVTSKVYNGEEQEPDFTVDGIQGTDAITFVVTPDREAINVGDYNFEVALPATSIAENYEISGTWTTNFEITPFELILDLTGLELSVEYDATDKKDDFVELLADYTPIFLNDVFGDDVVGIDGEPDFSGIDEAIDAGTYTATVALNNSNYIVKDGGVVLTITPKLIDIVWGETEFTYTGIPQAPEAEFAAEEIYSRDGEVKLVITGEETDANTEETPSYTATAEFDNDNYGVKETAEQEFVINPAKIVVEWGDVIEFTYDGTEQAPDMVYVSGLVNEDEVNVLGLEVTGAEIDANTEETPVYTATAIVSATTNYVVSEEIAEQEFTILPFKLNVTWSDEVALPYNGTFQAPEIDFAEGETDRIIVINEVKDEVNIVVTGKEKNVGEGYIATATFDNTNYVVTDATKDVEFSITAVDVEAIIWGETNLQWTGELQAPTATIAGLGDDGEEIVLVVSGQETDIGGPYTATAALPAELVGNYILPEENTKEFYIVKRMLTVIWGDIEVDYDGESHIPTATIDGDWDVEIDINGEAVTEVGEYTEHFYVTLANEEDEDFYEFENGILAVFKIKATTAIVDKNKNNRYGIRFAKNIVSDKAEMSVIIPENAKIVEAKFAIYDVAGNVVFSTTSQNGKADWDLRNNAGRNVANGSYLVIAEVKDLSGKTQQYSAKLGVKR